VLNVKSEVRGYAEGLSKINEVHIWGLEKVVNLVSSDGKTHEFSQEDDITVVTINEDVFEDFTVTIE